MPTLVQAQPILSSYVSHVVSATRIIFVIVLCRADPFMHHSMTGLGQDRHRPTFAS